jgi:hypothetical protein
MQKIVWIAKVTYDGICYSCGTHETMHIKYFDNEKSAIDWAINIHSKYAAEAEEEDTSCDYHWEIDSEILNS